MKEIREQQEMIDNEIDDKIKDIRRNELMEIQKDIALSNNRRYIGQTLQVFIEGRASDENGVFIGRTRYDAPDVDGYVFFESDYDILSGSIVDVEITESSEYDLYGRMI